jgi:hypothetical protein
MPQINVNGDLRIKGSVHATGTGTILDAEETLIITTPVNRDSFTVASEGEPQAWSLLARSAVGGHSR